MSPQPFPGRPAAAYLRMSTEHQRYSLEHQTRVIGEYAAVHGHDLVRTYTDAGKSGLRVEGRAGLSELLKDVVGGAAAFRTILVLDVSRWGRFQDPDEGAHYEFVCRSSGIAVEYCAEAFENDGSLASSLIKQLKRTMAAEYSRDLSVKIASIQRRLAAKGYWMSGAAGFGLRRMMIDQHGQPAGVLQPRQRKAIQGFRVILVPGPPAEVAVVGRIFQLFNRNGMTRRAIAKLLNEDGVAGEFGKAWTARTVAGVLSKEKYIGANVFGRTAKNLKRRSSAVAPELWVRCEKAFEPIVETAAFRRAARRTAERTVQMSDPQMLRALRRLLRAQGFLSARLINDARGLPCVSIYSRRFGGLKGAYAQIGYDRAAALRGRCRRMSNEAALKGLGELRDRRGVLSAHIVNGAPGVPGADGFRERFGSLEAAYRLVGYDPAGVGPYRPRRDTRFAKPQMILGLQRLLAAKGRLSMGLIDADPELPCHSTYQRRFGSLQAAFDLVGYRPARLWGVAAASARGRRRRLRRLTATRAAPPHA